MEIRPIKDDQGYDRALKRVEQLWGAVPDTREADELEILVALIDAYEREHYPVDLPDAVDAIKFRLEQEGKDYRSLIGILGQRTRVYEVMRRDRPLSLNMIRKLHNILEIPAKVLIQPSSGRKKQRSVATGRKKSRSMRRSA
jgi:HTH-type transcriptional regulator/antitoxin HigA